MQICFFAYSTVKYARSSTFTRRQFGQKNFRYSFSASGGFSVPFILYDVTPGTPKTGHPDQNRRTNSHAAANTNTNCGHPSVSGTKSYRITPIQANFHSKLGTAGVHSRSSGRRHSVGHLPNIRHPHRLHRSSKRHR